MPGGRVVWILAHSRGHIVFSRIMRTILIAAMSFVFGMILYSLPAPPKVFWALAGGGTFFAALTYATWTGKFEIQGRNENQEERRNR